MPKRKFGATPIDPNETGLDPQFGNVEDLPRGVKRQTAHIHLNGACPEKLNYSRLTFTFPECLGIKETLENKAKSTSCIPTVDMNVQVNLPVIKDVRIDLFRRPQEFTQKMVLQAADHNLQNTIYENDLQFILTGEDQLTDKAPSVSDETQSLSVDDPGAASSLSSAIYAKFISAPSPNTDQDFAVPLEPTGKKGNSWLYGATLDGVVGLNYAQVAQEFIRNNTHIAPPVATHYEINNIQAKGYLLLKDHVNLFVKVPQNAINEQNVFIARMIIDYTTRSVSLSSLLVWKQQLTEFIPKQVQWRIYKQTRAQKKNGWNVLVSRGSVSETGVGDQPTSSTDFPDIDN